MLIADPPGKMEPRPKSRLPRSGLVQCRLSQSDCHTWTTPGRRATLRRLAQERTPAWKMTRRTRSNGQRQPRSMPSHRHERCVRRRAPRGPCSASPQSMAEGLRESWRRSNGGGRAGSTPRWRSAASLGGCSGRHDHRRLRAPLQATAAAACGCDAGPTRSQFATTRRSSRWPRQRNFPKRLLGARVGLMEGPGLPQTSAPRSPIPGLARGSCAPPAQDSPSMARLRNLLERAAEDRVGPMESTARGTPPPVHLSPALNPTARGFLRRSGPPTARKRLSEQDAMAQPVHMLRASLA